MRPLAAHYFTSLDGVVDAPHEWHFPYVTPELDEVIAAATDGVDALLMGRTTYQEWAAFWPDQSGFEMADFINGTPKYVASRTLRTLTWERSTLLPNPAVDAVAELKARPGGRIAVNGSGTLVRTLLSAGLVDELHLLVHPLVVGRGKHLFEQGARTVGLQLVHERAFDNGVTHRTYRPVSAATAA